MGEQAVYPATLGIRVNGFAANAAREMAVKQRSQQQDALPLAKQRALQKAGTSRNDTDRTFDR